MVRLVDPDRGHVEIGGVDLREVDVASLRSAVAVVFQESFLFAESVRSNIALDSGASDDEVERAAVIAACDRFIRALPHGYDTVVGERGLTLSGGERQRVALARALVREAPPADPRRRDERGRPVDRGRDPGGAAPRARDDARRRGLPPVDDPPGRPGDLPARADGSRRPGRTRSCSRPSPGTRRSSGPTSEVSGDGRRARRACAAPTTSCPCPTSSRARSGCCAAACARALSCARASASR